MAYLNNNEHETIHALWVQYERASKSIASSTVSALWTNVDIACKQYINTGDITIKAELVKLLLSTHALDMHYYGNDHASFDLAKRISAFFTTTGCPALVTKSPIHAQLLAFVCTKLAYVTEETGPLRAAISVAEILAAWSEKPVDIAVAFKPAEVIALLYGSAVEPFYRDDVNDQDDLPGYLLRLKLPVLGMPGYAGNNMLEMGIALPEDLVGDLKP